MIPAPPRLELRRDAPTRVALVDAVTGAAPAQPTQVELVDDGERLIATFLASDADPWATRTARDAPLWEEEVVELFLCADERSAATPRRYVEFEVNPLGALFDAAVESPHGDRTDWRVDAGWNCEGIEAGALVEPHAGRWRARLAVPWAAVPGGGREQTIWRCNLLRIDRPRDGRTVQYSAWSPTFVAPADFHRPARFGTLVRIG